MNELIEKLGLVNPVDFTRLFVHPDTRTMLDRLCRRITGEGRECFVHIGGYRIRLIENLNMPKGKAFFGGKVLNLEDYVGV